MSYNIYNKMKNLIRRIILEELNSSSVPDTIDPFDEKGVYNKNLTDFYFHAPKRGASPVTELKKCQEETGCKLYFQKGGIFWKDYFGYFNPEDYGKGQLIMALQSILGTPTLLDKSKASLDASRGVVTIEGDFIVDNPDKFIIYQYNEKSRKYEKTNKKFNSEGRLI